MKIGDYKEYIELKEDFTKLSKDYDLLLDKLCQKDLLIDELRNQIESMEDQAHDYIKLQLKKTTDLLLDDLQIYKNSLEEEKENLIRCNNLKEEYLKLQLKKVIDLLD